VALGAETFERRGTALDEAIRIFRTTWSQPSPVSFAGEVYSFEPQHVNPKPARAGGPPIWIGGHGRRALRRAAELSDLAAQRRQCHSARFFGSADYGGWQELKTHR